MSAAEKHAQHLTQMIGRLEALASLATHKLAQSVPTSAIGVGILQALNDEQVYLLTPEGCPLSNVIPKGFCQECGYKHDKGLPHADYPLPGSRRNAIKGAPRFDPIPANEQLTDLCDDCQLEEMEENTDG